MVGIISISSWSSYCFLSVAFDHLDAASKYRDRSVRCAFRANWTIDWFCLRFSFLLFCFWNRSSDLRLLSRGQKRKLIGKRQYSWVASFPNNPKSWCFDPLSPFIYLFSLNRLWKSKRAKKKKSFMRDRVCRNGEECQGKSWPKCIFHYTYMMHWMIWFHFTISGSDNEVIILLLFVFFF